MEGNATMLGDGHALWLSEAVLWTTWVHLGVLTAMTECRFLCVDANNFQSIAGNFDHRGYDPRVYASSFIDSLNEESLVPLLSDLPIDKRRLTIASQNTRATTRSSISIANTLNRASQAMQWLGTLGSGIGIKPMKSS